MAGLIENLYVQQAVRSVVSNLTGSFAAGSIGGTLAGSLLNGGVSSRQIAGTLITGASFLESELGRSSAVPSNALYNRNFSISSYNNPDTMISRSKDATTGGPTLSYPTEQAPYFLSLTFYEYARQAPLADTTTNQLGTVNLPLPDGQGFTDNTTVAWTATELGIVGNVLDELQRTGTINLGSNGSVNLQNLGNEKALGDITMRAVSEIGKRTVGNEIVSAAESVAGVAANPSLSMLFKGIRDFRRFTFNWTFAPKTPEESETIKQIGKYLKSKQLPTLTGSGGNAGGSSLYFNYPAIVKPAFSLGSDYTTDFKFCVVHSVNINYSPQGVAPSFFKGTNAPTFIQMTMEIQEMEYRLATDYETDVTGSISGKSIAGGAIDKLGSTISSKITQAFS